MRLTASLTHTSMHIIRRLHMQQERISYHGDKQVLLRVTDQIPTETKIHSLSKIFL